mmetsp:Transcript_7482/g.13422  ORF Transcript_7482/g.13422 Transcript_7482/m.13422 type:complete len:425 (-) Transcript_7482:221-1495(-)
MVCAIDFRSYFVGWDRFLGSSDMPKRKRKRDSFDASSTSKSLRKLQPTDSLLQRIDVGPAAVVIPKVSKALRAGKGDGSDRGVDLTSNGEEYPQPLPTREVVCDRQQAWTKNLSRKNVWRPVPRRKQFKATNVLRIVNPCQPLSYKEYLEWLQESSAEMEAAEPDATGLSGLKYLRFLAGPPPPPRFMSPLTEEEREIAGRGLDDGDPSEVLVDRFSVKVTRQQLACLNPATWLNDEVVNFYCKLLQERCDQAAGKVPSCWLPNTFFWPKLSGEGTRTYSYKDVKRWTIRAKVDIFEKDYVIFPINVNSMHWTCGAINLRDKCFHYLDSMDQSPPSTFVPFLRRYLDDEHKSRRGAPLAGVDEWGLVHVDVPQQENGYDCGVFTCCFAECLSSDRQFSFDQSDIAGMRLRLAARIITGDSQWTT